MRTNLQDEINGILGGSVTESQCDALEKLFGSIKITPAEHLNNTQPLSSSTQQSSFLPNYTFDGLSPEQCSRWKDFYDEYDALGPYPRANPLKNIYIKYEDILGTITAGSGKNGKIRKENYQDRLRHAKYSFEEYKKKCAASKHKGKGPGRPKGAITKKTCEQIPKSDTSSETQVSVIPNTRRAQRRTKNVVFSPTKMVQSYDDRSC